jgi:antitoxin component YwqK of YwqJK toxin-antitoxin module
MLRVERRRLRNTEWDTFTYGGDPFSGLAYATDSQGNQLFEGEFRDGMRWGVHREWHFPGVLASEITYRWNLPWGAARRWHANGQLESEAEFELGVCLRQKEWSEDGSLIAEYVLHEQDADWRTLCAQREAFSRLAAPGDSASSS